MIPQNARRLLEALGYFTRYQKLYVRAFSAKKMPLEARLNYDTAYRKGGSILPLSPMGCIDLQTNVYIPSNGKLKGKPQPNGWDFLRKINQQPQGMYFTVNYGGQDIPSIQEAHSLFYEIDGGDKDSQWAKVRSLELELGVQLTVVETKNSLHVYILLAEPLANLALWSKLQQRLIQKMGSDISIHNPNRVLRIPDFDYWSWDETTQTPINDGPIKLIQVGSPVPLAQAESVLPPWETTQWSPPTEKVVPNWSGPSEFLDYWNMANIAVYLPGYNAKGRGTWATAQCPYQGPGHSSNPSNDSLHISPDGAPKCQAGCSGRDVLEAGLSYAISMGYPTLEQWARAKGLWREKAQPPTLPDEQAIAPPATEFPADLVPVGKQQAVSDAALSSGSPQPDAPTKGEPPTTAKVVSAPLVPIPEADNEELAYNHPKSKGDGKGTTLFGAAIRSLKLSPEGEDIVSRYCWVFTKDEYFDLRTQVVIKGKQLSFLYDHKTGFFRESSNWIKLPQGDKPKKVGVLDLLEAHDRVCFDYGYAPGIGPLIPPTELEGLPRANLWKPTPKGQAGATREDVAPWLERLYNLFPGAVGDYLLQFLAFTVQCPEVKCDFAPLLYSEKRRSGREQLLSPVAAMFSEVNQGAEVYCSSYDPRYTDILMGKRLVLINEVKKPTGREFPDPNHWLKNHIGHSADPTKVYTRKGLGAVQMADFANFILLTNEQDAVTIMEDEGRYWPVESTWKGPESDYEALGRFYNLGGYAKVWGFLYGVSLEGFSPYRPNLALSNFTEFCGATEADARSLVLDTMEAQTEPFLSHHDLKQLLSEYQLPELADARMLRKLLANSPWTLTAANAMRVSQWEGKTRYKSHLVYDKQLTAEDARRLWMEAHQ